MEVIIITLGVSMGGVIILILIAIISKTIRQGSENKEAGELASLSESSNPDLVGGSESFLTLDMASESRFKTLTRQLPENL
ncbi:UNVERIFIED_CONTAM: hypothetical protein HDU68_005263 [Siphonaria sp. JEL0065]|nr:hypothetical protein HDU68_005263 [Siphonaria sp. JEL0065]